MKELTKNEAVVTDEIILLKAQLEEELGEYSDAMKTLEQIKDKSGLGAEYSLALDRIKAENAAENILPEGNIYNI